MAKPKQTTTDANQSTALTTFVPAASLSNNLEKHGASLSVTGVVLPSNLSLDACVDVMNAITMFKTTFDGSYRWAVGDVVGFSQDKWGEKKYTQVAAQVEMDYGDLRNCIWVARKIPPSYRIPGLSWSHHRIVATDDIPDLDDKLKLLHEALDNKMSAAEFKVAVDAYLKAKKVVQPEPEDPPQPDSKPSNPPPPPSQPVTSFAAVAKWIEMANSQSEIEWCIKVLAKKLTGLKFIGELFLMLEERSVEIGNSLGLVAAIDATPTEADKIANQALKSLEVDEDGVIIDHDDEGGDGDEQSIDGVLDDDKLEPSDDQVVEVSPLADKIEQELIAEDAGETEVKVTGDPEYVSLDEVLEVTSDDEIPADRPWEI